jgi:APA family basic amino acid/polyamine antiporter
MNQAKDSSGGLKRSLGGTFALAVTVGGILGLGILRTPGEIANTIHDPVLYMALWIFGGLFVLLSTNVVVELIGMTERSGGCYQLVRRAFGPYPGFLIGWVDWLSFVGDIALKAVVITEFASLLFPQIIPWQTPLAIAVTSVFAALQIRGIGLGAMIQKVAAAGIAFIIVGFTLALLIAGPAEVAVSEAVATTRTGINDWSLVIAGIIFTYDGWMYAAYFSGEIKGGSGAVARACIRGVVVVIVLFVALNAALVWSVPLPSIAGHDLALAGALEMAISPTASAIVIVAAILILLAHQNLLYMGAPRILHAMAVDGLATKRAQTVGRSGNPLFAVMISWAISVGLILIGGFEFLLQLCVFFFVFLYVILIIGVIVLRRRSPEVDRPFKAWAHPWSTWFCLVGWSIITAFQAYAELGTAIYALAMIVVSAPTYLYLLRSRN